MSSLTSRVCVVGVGLIGGSFGMALKKRGLASSIVGVGRNPDRLRRAVELGAIDSWTTDLRAGVCDADLVYIATPVGSEAKFIRQAASSASPGCVITDAGSTKGVICAEAEASAPDGVRFVGGHPMAGSEQTGVEAGSPDLFVGATYVLTRTPSTDGAALDTLTAIVQAIGSRPLVMSPDAHDVCAAVVSHLPHIVAAALVETARIESESHPEVYDLIAGSFRDMTRVAASSPELWRDICLSNPEAIAKAVGVFRTAVDSAVDAISAGDADGFERWFAQAGRTRGAIVRR